jgi:hypothetical protein
VSATRSSGYRSARSEDFSSCTDFSSTAELVPVRVPGALPLVLWPTSRAPSPFFSLELGSRVAGCSCSWSCADRLLAFALSCLEDFDFCQIFVRFLLQVLASVFS